MSTPLSPLRLLQRSRLLRRVGGLLTTPGTTLGQIEAEGGGLADAVALVLVGVVAFRLPELINAILGLFETSGGFIRLLGVASAEVRDAAWVVLPAAVAITALAGKGRDATRDLDLGAACYVPAFAIRGLARAIDAVAQHRVLSPTIVTAVGALGAAVVLVPAIRIARARAPLAGTAPPPAGEVPPPPSGPPASGPGVAALAAALATIAVVAIGLAGNAVWSSRHIDALRPMRQGHDAPAFALPLVSTGNDRRPILSSETLHGKVALLDFWATWCEPCLAMIPVLHDLHRDWAPRGLALVGINSDGGGATPDEVAAFVTKHRFPYPVVLDREGEVGARYKVQALPSLVVIGRDGRVRATFMGYTRRETLEREIREALAGEDEPPSTPGAPSPP